MTPDTPTPDFSTPGLRTLGLPRLTAGLTPGAPRLTHRAHLAAHGRLSPLPLPDLISLTEAIALRGRGGAAFAMARKLRAVAAATDGAGERPRPTVIVNGCEGEPASFKDTVLLTRTPHLVLDGALLAAAALGADTVAFGVARPRAEACIRAALAERGLHRRGAGSRSRSRSLRHRAPQTSVVRVPERMVSGEASALLRAVRGGPSLPAGAAARAHASDEGVLLCNAETYAQLAIAARLGADAYATTGIPAEPGTLLLTLSGGVPATTVVEAPTGTPLAYLLQALGAAPDLSGVLIGGYHGAWADPYAAREISLAHTTLAASGRTLGAGAILPLPASTCPLGETARVAHWLAAESAGQCGPCRLGLPTLAGQLDAVVRGEGRAPLAALRDTARSVRRRGACKHPDGSSRMVLSALAAFTDDLAAHVLGAGCGRPVQGVLPLPGTPGTAAPPGSGTPSPSDLTDPPAARLTVDWTLCEAHGLCADLLPEAVRLDADGYPSRTDTPLPAHLTARARQAVHRCPALALRLTR
ncbi:NADH-ubiquinone oxidoreductase-F iron-sulfur binding region domain-containing protein [Streptomyces boninensis]|uniref:NADH-ubiquinone oxidoreductase-F iron-sulfur binding region domain-containing protein n=1 Tax=Streptomyces boninensis TaxID=2039455 RepID=UPI003B21B19E